MKQQAYGPAADDFSRAIKLRLDDQNAWKGRGSAYMSMAHYRDAIDDLDQAIRLKPDFLEALIDRGFSQGQLGDFLKELPMVCVLAMP